jgi:PleD family two-component response regulator
VDEKAATILVIDDAEDIREVLKDRLEFHAYRVLTASNGVEGLACIRAERPDLVLLDLLMPRLDGLGVLRGGEDYPEAEVRMEAGDLLVLYSDGIPEAQNAQGDFYEEGRLEGVVRRCAEEMDARALVNEVVRDVTAFRGEVAQLDDMTVVVLRCVG